MSPSVSAYRGLLRASRELFRGDTKALAASREQIRAAFMNNRNLTDESEVEARLADAEEARTMLATNFVQAKLAPSGDRYVTRLPSSVNELQNDEGVTEVESMSADDEFSREQAGRAAERGGKASSSP